MTLSDGQPAGKKSGMRTLAMVSVIAGIGGVVLLGVGVACAQGKFVAWSLIPTILAILTGAWARRETANRWADVGLFLGAIAGISYLAVFVHSVFFGD